MLVKLIEIGITVGQSSPKLLMGKFIKNYAIIINESR